MRVGSPTGCNSRTACKFTSSAALFCAFLVVFIGCGDDGSKCTDIPIPPPPMPEKVFKIMADAYESRDMDRYASCLADDYVHTFWSSGWGLPGLDSLRREADLEYARKLFENENVGDITMDVTILGGPWPTDSGLLYRLEPFVKVEVGEPAGAGTTGGSWGELKVLLAQDELSCDPCVCIAFSTFLDVELIEDPADTTSWVISKVLESHKTK